MNERAQNVVNHISEGLSGVQKKEFFVKAHVEIDIREVAQELVNSGYKIEEYSFGVQKGKENLGEIHRLVIRSAYSNQNYKDQNYKDQNYKDLFDKIFGKDNPFI